mmetsp:Transcript_31637/g.57465  ORF Transcript_31637/g.57465 Transcript_31637/m.57465 type:complete len:227 (+) Transcript_31637:251-931(+)
MLEGVHRNPGVLGDERGEGVCEVVSRMATRASRQKIPLGRSNFRTRRRMAEQRSAHQKTIQQFVLLKQSAADAIKDKARHKIRQQLQSRRYVLVLLALLDAVAEQACKVRQAELIHGRDQRQIRDHKVQNRPSCRCWTIVFTCFVDGLLCHLCFSDAIRNDSTSEFGVVECVDQLLIIQNVAAAFLQKLQNSVLQLCQLFLVRRNAHHQPVLCLLQIRSLHAHHLA